MVTNLSGLPAVPVPWRLSVPILIRGPSIITIIIMSCRRDDTPPRTYSRVESWLDSQLGSSDRNQSEINSFSAVKHV
jgi:hypothetical protein